MTGIDDIVKEFLVESHENLDRLDVDLVALEESPAEKARIAGIFRTIHTIKGTCGFLGFQKLERVTHAGESLLSRLRDGRLEMGDEIADALLALVDAVRAMLAGIEAGSGEGTSDYADLVAQLERLQHEAATEASPPVETRTDVRASPLPDPAAVDGRLIRTRRNLRAELGLAPVASAVEPPVRSSSALLPPAGALVAPSVGEAASITTPPHPKHGIADATVRVDVDLLDELMDLVGELVLARNRILELGARAGDAEMAATTQRLDLVTSDLQDRVMRTRMQPIGSVWSKLPRVVRDLARSLCKEVRLEMQGQDTELDRTLLEAIRDPLTHLVRNCVDHGIETADVRRSAGKPAEGVIRLSAYHEGGQVIIEIGDDGTGILADRVRRTAVARGLLSAESAARMPDGESIELVFLPGFSTAQSITNVSGRGVGLDVVKTNIEAIGGTIDVRTSPGAGTTFRLQIPLTLAIVPALIARARGERFAIPQANLHELLRAGAGVIERVQGASVFRLRGRLLPLVDLGVVLGLSCPSALSPLTFPSIAVLTAGEQLFGLLVDEVEDVEEIVVKPLGRHLRALGTYAGATIRGDGRVTLILDALGLAQRAHVFSASQVQTPSGNAGPRATDPSQRAFLVALVGGNRRVAVPLQSVERLEEFARTSVERAGDARVVQHRGRILPLEFLAERLGLDASPAKVLQVVVASLHDRSVGLVVERILDIVVEAAAVDESVRRSGFSGALVVQGRVCDVVDVAALARAGSVATPSAAEAAAT